MISLRPAFQPYNPLMCSASSTLESVVAKLVKNGLHRLYVCDNDLRPVGVITLTDILRRVCLSRA